jgi:hypothetical protein
MFVCHVQVVARLLNVPVAEHQLNDADVDAIRQQPRLDSVVPFAGRL